MRKTRFFFLLASLFAVLCILDYGIGKFLEYLYFNQKQGKLYNITYAIEKQTNDVIIMGSSRAMHHYNPDIISDSLKTVLLQCRIWRSRYFVSWSDIKYDTSKVYSQNYNSGCKQLWVINKWSILWSTIHSKPLCSQTSYFKRNG